MTIVAVRFAMRAVAIIALLAMAARAVQAQVNAAPLLRPAAACATASATAGGGCLLMEGKPAIRPERVAGEIVAGTYAGVAGYFLGRGIGTIATMMMSSEEDRTRDQIVNGVGLVGAAFAIGGTVYAIGDMGSETGSFPATMAGVTVGAAASLAISRVVFRGRVPADEGSAKRKWLVATLESSLPALGATLAFNASRKWQR